MATKIYITIDREGLINALSLTKTPHPEEIECEVEDGHEVIKNPLIFRYKDGKVFKDEDYQKKEMDRWKFWKDKPTTDGQISELAYQLMNMESEVSGAQEMAAASTFELMVLDSEIQETQSSNAELMFQLMMKGVL